jgi:hypothetical protein
MVTEFACGVAVLRKDELSEDADRIDVTWIGEMLDFNGEAHPHETNTIAKRNLRD